MSILKIYTASQPFLDLFCENVAQKLFQSLQYIVHIIGMHHFTFHYTDIHLLLIWKMRIFI
jgi:hypothetical protein